ncbi:MAG: DUF4350 domain-containing protein [Spirochaetes bacterium]|nr:DUF4350 domain-containing protein [Spirochaetota bacterium]
MKNRFLFLISAVFFVIFVITLFISASGKVDWDYYYTWNTRKPFGSYVVFNLMQYYFPDKKIEIRKESAYYLLSENEFTGTNLIFISSILQFDEYDYSELLEFAERGNNVFISGYIDNPDLIENLGIKYVSHGQEKEHELVFGNGIRYTVFSKINSFCMEISPESSHSIIAVNEDNQAVYAGFRRGKGAFYVFSMPEMLTNYEIVKNPSREYLSRIFSNVPVNDVIWDEYYKPKNRMSGNFLHYVKSEPALKRSYYLLMVMILIFFFFRIKREQRIIRIIPPEENKIMAFLHQSGNLLYRSSSNKKISGKKIRYFEYYLEKHFNIIPEWNSASADYISDFSIRTGCGYESAEKIIRLIALINGTGKISDRLLSDLDRNIVEFKRNFQGEKNG